MSRKKKYFYSIDAIICSSHIFVIQNFLVYMIGATMLDDEPFDECVERLAQKYRYTSTNYFDALTDRYPLRFEHAYIQKLYGKFAASTNTIKKINVRKLLVCACLVLDNENFCEWDRAREMIYILVYMWRADNPTVYMSSFEINMYMPFVAGDMLKLKKRSRGCWSFCRR